MPWYVLLIIALASVGLVLAMLAWLGVRAWRLLKHGIAVSRRIAPLAGRLQSRADEAAATAEHLAASAGRLDANIARMQVALERLRVVGQALDDAVRPYRRIADWLGGEREWSYQSI